VFAQLTEDLLDLTATTKGFAGAPYAQNEEPGCSSSSLCCSIWLCCSIACFSPAA
jgi:hypothetical protein